jgi:hypothetical protein
MLYAYPNMYLDVPVVNWILGRRLLSSVGVFTETQPAWFGLTALGDCLRTAAPGSMRS